MSEAMLSKSGMIIPERDSQVQLEQRMHRGDLRSKKSRFSASWPQTPPNGRGPREENCIGFPVHLTTRDCPAIKQAVLLQLTLVSGLLSGWTSSTQSMFKFLDPIQERRQK